MARYRVLKPSFINNVYHDAGADDEVEYEGAVADNLELIGKPHEHKKHAEPPREEESLA